MKITVDFQRGGIALPAGAGITNPRFLTGSYDPERDVFWPEGFGQTAAGASNPVTHPPGQRIGVFMRSKVAFWADAAELTAEMGAPPVKAAAAKGKEPRA